MYEGITLQLKGTNFSIMIIIMSNSLYAVDVVPSGLSEGSCVYVPLRANPKKKSRQQITKDTQ